MAKSNSKSRRHTEPYVRQTRRFRWQPRPKKPSRFYDIFPNVEYRGIK